MPTSMGHRVGVRGSRSAAGNASSLETEQATHRTSAVASWLCAWTIVCAQSNSRLIRRIFIPGVLRSLMCRIAARAAYRLTPHDSTLVRH